MQKQFEIALTFDDVLLVPQYSDILHRADVDISVFLHKNLKLDIPLISANMDMVTESDMAIALAKSGGLGIIHRFLTVEEEVKEVKKVKKFGLKVGASVGVKNGEQPRARALVEAGADLIALDIAHGHSEAAGRMLRFLKKITKLPIMAGNVATPEGVMFLAKNGADMVKIGIGPGSACTTRIKTGSGVPQFSAILACAKAAKKIKLPIIADGGMKIPGDVVKALAAGATAVLSGNLFAGTDECPGKIITVDGKKYKSYRGMASLAANQHRTDKALQAGKYVTEGVDGLVPYKGSAKMAIAELVGGIRSGFTYSGSRNLAEFHKKANFVQVTLAGLKESGVHDIKTL